MGVRMSDFASQIFKSKKEDTMALEQKKFDALYKKGLKESKKLKLSSRSQREEYPIDFVVTWVDSSDEKWISEKKKFSMQKDDNCYNSDARYRDWDNFHYWFRAVEKYAPWVRYIFVITYGHIPHWLNRNHPKIKIICHSEYIPQEWLPTFSSRPIELNMWRINELSEHFVYFNDDIFINRMVEPSDFFEDGMPKLSAVGRPIYVNSNQSIAWERCLLNNYAIINNSFEIRQCIEKNPEKWFSVLYTETEREYNMRILKDGYIAGMEIPHVAVPFLKSSFQDAWSKQNNILKKTSNSKFRSENDVTIYLIILWQIFSGKFISVQSGYLGVAYNISSHSISRILNALKKETCRLLCINDGDSTDEVEVEFLRQQIKEGLDEKFSSKSSFEI